MLDLFICEGFSAVGSLHKQPVINKHLLRMISRYLAEKNTTNRKKLYRRCVSLANKYKYKYNTKNKFKEFSI